MRAIVVRTGANQMLKVEEENKSSTLELKEIKAKIKTLEERISKQDTVVSSAQTAAIVSVCNVIV